MRPVERNCFGCGMCCIGTDGVYCIYWDNGCEIYERRPEGCREYQCAWSLGEGTIRPEEAGMLIKDEQSVFVKSSEGIISYIDKQEKPPSALPIATKLNSLLNGDRR